MASGTYRPLLVLAAVGFLPCLIAFARIGDARTWWSIATSALVSFLGMRVTARIIPVLKASTLRAGLSGKDINKRGTEAGEKPIPESLGLAPGELKPHHVEHLCCAAGRHLPTSCLSAEGQLQAAVLLQGSEAGRAPHVLNDCCCTAMSSKEHSEASPSHHALTSRQTAPPPPPPLPPRCITCLSIESRP